jgi:hypothetical protein
MLFHSIIDQNEKISTLQENYPLRDFSWLGKILNTLAIQKLIWLI